MKLPFERVVDAHGERVLRVCRAVLGPQDADDAWSETFLSAMRAYPDLPDEANVEAWLVRIAHRKAIDVVRARTRAPLLVDDLSETPSAIGVPGVGQPELWAQVAALPPKQRRAIAYHYICGLPYAEVAEILGGSTDAARRAAADGLKKLKKTIPGELMEGEFS